MLRRGVSVRACCIFACSGPLFVFPDDAFLYSSCNTMWLSRAAAARAAFVPRAHFAGAGARRWCSARAGDEEAENVEAEEEVDFDRNPLSTGMRQCSTRHDVADYMLKQDGAALFDTHDLEAARMFANMQDSPLTSRVGRAMEQMSSRMKGRFKESGTTRGSHNKKLINIIKGKVDNPKDKDVHTPRQKTKKASGSVAIYLEFASCYAQICYGYALNKGGMRAMKDSQNPLYHLAMETTSSAVDRIAERAAKMNMIDRPQVVPTAILSLGLLDLKGLWTQRMQRYVCGEVDGRPAFADWIAGTERQAGWDSDELANVLWGSVEMGLHKTPETRRLIESVLHRASQDVILVSCTASTLVRLLKVTSTMEDKHGPIAEASKELFNSGERRITSLASPHAVPTELTMLPAEVTAVPDTTEIAHVGERVLVEDYADENFLIGSMTLGQIIEVVEAYNATGRADSFVHKAVIGRILSSGEVCCSPVAHTHTHTHTVEHSFATRLRRTLWLPSNFSGCSSAPTAAPCTTCCATR